MKKKSLLMIAITLILLAVGVTPILQAQTDQRTRENTWIRDMGVKVDDPTNLNPVQGFTTASARYFGGVEEFMSEQLFYYNPMNGTLVPWLATGYEFTSDFMQATVHIRHGVEWSDGVPFTAQDVVYTENLIRGNPALGADLSGRWPSTALTSITAPDNYTIVLNFNQSNPRSYWDIISNWFGSPLFAVPQHIYSTVNATSFLDSTPIRTGPYTLESASSELFVFKRNPNYWGAKTGFVPLPQPQYVVVQYSATPDVSAMESVKHQLDFAAIGQGSTIDLIKSLNPNATAWSDTPPYGAVDFNARAISVNEAIYPLNLPEVRWAISYALDRTSLVSTAFDEMSPGIQGMPWPTIGALQQYLNESIVAQYNCTEYNTNKSIALLEGLGFTKGSDGIYVTPNGTRLSFELLVQTPETEFNAAGLIMKTDLAVVGIELLLKPVDHTQMSNLWYSRQYQLALSWYGENKDPYYFYDIFNIKYIKPVGVMGFEKENPVGWPNATFSNLVDQLAMIRSDSAAATPILNQLQLIFLQQLPVIGYGNAFCYGVYDQKYWIGWPSTKDPYLWPMYISPQWMLLMFRMISVPQPAATTQATGVDYMTVAIITAAAIIVAVLATYAILRTRMQRKPQVTTKPN
jgi:peptide/nickel transport system substrate-binding protein